MDKVLLGLVGAFITLAIHSVTVVYKMGHVMARLEELERWRNNMRVDMHEISDKLEKIEKTLEGLSMLIQERTERRTFPRHE